MALTRHGKLAVSEDVCCRPETPAQGAPSLRNVDASGSDSSTTGVQGDRLMNMDDSTELELLLARCEPDVFQCLPPFRFEESEDEGVNAAISPIFDIASDLDLESDDSRTTHQASFSQMAQSNGKPAVRPPFSHRNGGPCDHCGVKGQ